MKKVVKISIGNLVFTVEHEAYYAIKGYLDEIQDYYDSSENSKEILEGIEERMAELFIEKCGVGKVITLSVVTEVTDILGRPEVFGEESDVRPSGFDTKGKVAKKFYRDPDNKVFGGVCSGLAAYFSMDAILVRILFVLFFFGFSLLGMIHFEAPSFLFLAYIVMWVVVPEARTVEQKCAMRGESPDFSNIHQHMQRELRNAGSNIKRVVGGQSRNIKAVIGRILTILFSVVFLVVSLIGIGSITFIATGVEIFGDMAPIDMFSYIEMGSVTPLFFKIVVLSFVLLPFIGMLYLAIKLMFHFKAPRIRPGLIIFLLWIVSFVGVIYLSVKTSRPYWNQAHYSGEIDLNTASDTLYIDLEYGGELPSDALYYRAGHSLYEIFWMDQQKNSIVMFPSIKLVRQSKEDGGLLKYETTAFSKSLSEARFKSKERMPLITIGDSLITISPEVYDRGRKFDGTYHEILIYIPKDMEVKVRKPLEHNFDDIIVSGWPFDRDCFFEMF